LTEKTSTGRLISAIAGIVLIISLFLTWYGAPEVVSQFAEQAGVDTGANAFSSTDIAGLFLLITGIIAIVPAALDIFDLEIELPVEPGLVILVLGAIGIAWVLLRIVDKPGGGGVSVSLGIGIWISLIGAIGVAAGGFLQKQDEEAGVADPGGYGAVPPAAAPPAAAPPAAPPPAAAPPAAAPPAAAPPAAAPPQAPPPAAPPAAAPPVQPPPPAAPPEQQPPQPPAV
jgi:hypothetical protein